MDPKRVLIVAYKTAATQALADAVREHGVKLADDDLSPSDAVIPPEDLSLEEAQELLQNEGFIPDVPAVS